MTKTLALAVLALVGTGCKSGRSATPGEKNAEKSAPAVASTAAAAAPSVSPLMAAVQAVDACAKGGDCRAALGG